MKHKFLILASTLFLSLSFAQTKMKDLKDLINKNEDAITLIQTWKKSARNKVQILEKDSLKSKEALFNIQISTRSPMGAIVFHTGGILINDGWIRIYGSGNNKLDRNLPDWNKGKTFENFGEKPGHLIIADDAIGSFFLLNGGDLGSDLGKVYYFAPDSLETEPLDLTYSDFINFCFNGNVDGFYKDLRWKNWEKDFKDLSTNEAFIFYPYLWTKEGRDIDSVQKSKVSIEEVYKLKVSKMNPIDK
ncbi:uncharacterized protein DUF2625 [Chryseobacterium geocarposphaerae]|uniref:Uncharacterized protein DUF2625 n=2 Tax=Chryseobacterium geocarposphaerae TaxID=1416776 RepID=A0A2M9C7D8_9FLAO|nr:uncharacterized protein DUF2625 [Chryseobacterium geocarposphaerae]